MAKKQLEFLSSALIAHRGLHGGGVPENSLAAFGAAVRGGYIIELDVHVLADGSVAVFHDDNLQRMCGANVAIKGLTRRKLRKYRLDGSEEQIPLLKDVLSFIDGAVPIIIELKYDAPVGELENALGIILEEYNGQVALKSFHPLIVRRLRHKFRKLPVGQLYSHTMFKDVSGVRRWIFERVVKMSMHRSDFISVDKDDLNDMTVDILRSSGKPILAWTIQNSDEKMAALKLCDNCICEKIL